MTAEPVTCSGDEDRRMLLVMIPVLDYATRGRLCPQCHGPFLPGQQAMESWDQQVQIHIGCVREIYDAMMNILEPQRAADTEAEYDRVLQEYIELQGTLGAEPAGPHG